MRVAIVGRGLAGLGVAAALSGQGIQATLFDEGGVANGASGVCSGLLHPYPGLGARKSRFAEEALQETQTLIDWVEQQSGQSLASRSGILRLAIRPEQKERLLEYPDVKQLEDNLFSIESGWTVHCGDYLRALESLLQMRSVEFYTMKIDSLEQLSGYDRIVLACGWGVRRFVQLPVEYLKGQLLCYKGKAPFSRSYISKGYIANNREGFEVGSTYERGFVSDLPCKETALKLLPTYEGELIGIKAGVRVSPIGSYLPLIERLSSSVFVFTGLGSRGLLYHALYGKRVAEMVIRS